MPVAAEGDFAKASRAGLEVGLERYQSSEAAKLKDEIGSEFRGTEALLAGKQPLSLGGKIPVHRKILRRAFHREPFDMR